MKTVNPRIWLWAVALAGFANGAMALPEFDRERTVALATSLIRSEFEKHPQSTIPGVDFEHPVVMAAHAGAGRDFVFVSFTSTFAKWGAYVIFELCGSPTHAVPNGYGKVIDIDDFRHSVSKIGAATKLALPDVCAAKSAT